MRLEPAPVGPRLSALHVYPIKSAAGSAPLEWDVGTLGLVYDRRWMVVDGSGRMLTQRTLPRLGQIHPTVGDTVLRVETQGMPPLELPLEPRPSVSLPVTIWDDCCTATWTGERAARWFSDVLETDCSLVHVADANARTVDPDYAPAGHRVGFADAFPFLLISEASLADLNARLATPLPMNRFRPNLVIAGVEPFGEDRIGTFTIGGMRFTAVKPCVRCVVTTTDQTTGERGVEPLRTLATYRRSNGKVLFGQNVVHTGTGRLRVGDALLV
ncbi:MAG TPA: MOSC N-terminal beta barrel domain-containing protein [Gemmatimonadales bacterium]|nr:MOSC N-terminal beta barrel domain-containing protein [Gemmatimonadales bacterium]